MRINTSDFSGCSSPVRQANQKPVLPWLMAFMLCLGLAGCNGGGGKLSVVVDNGARSVDGQGPDARVNSPSALTFDASGNLYVADAGNHTIRKVKIDGSVSTLAGAAGYSGSSDGSGSVAKFNGPMGIVSDAAGNVYIADTGNNTIRKITTDGVVTTFAGTPGASGKLDGAGAAATFNRPQGIAVDAAGNLYVADTGNDKIRKISPSGVVTTLWFFAGFNIPLANTPQGIAVDAAGNLYVSDVLYGCVSMPIVGLSCTTTNATIRKIDTRGIVSILAGKQGATGSVDGTGTGASFGDPAGINLDALGNLYVADRANNTIRKITPAGVVTTLAGSAGSFGKDGRGNTDGTGTAASFYRPQGVATDTAGNVYAADTGNNAIRKITAEGVTTTIVGMLARFYDLSGVASDASGNLFVVDQTFNKIFKVDAAKNVTTLANLPYGATNDIVSDADGNHYVTDRLNRTIQKITPDGVVSVFAGTAGGVGILDGTGAAAKFSSPAGITIDVAGNLYVTDMSAIRKITPSGVVTTLAGSGVVGDADGTGSAAQFLSPTGIAIDATGNLYVADTGNNKIRKITTGGVVTTFAGTNYSALYIFNMMNGLPPAGCFSVDGSALAMFSGPSRMTMDADGDLYVIDTGMVAGSTCTSDDNYTIRKITMTGAVSTIADTKGWGRINLSAHPGMLTSITSPAAKTLIVTTSKSVLKLMLN